MKSFIIYCHAFIAAEYRRLPEWFKQLPWITYTYRLVYTLLFFLFFFLFQAKIETWFVGKILPYLKQSVFENNNKFRYTFLVAFSVMLFLWLKRFPKFKTVDFIVVGLYIIYRYIESNWIFFKFWGIAYLDLLWVAYNSKLLLLIYRSYSDEVRERRSFLDFDLSLDKSDKGDKLGMHTFAFELARTIVRIKSNHSIVIGINGEWGSGKTSLVHYVKYHLRKNQNIFKIEKKEKAKLDVISDLVKRMEFKERIRKKKQKLYLHQTIFIDFTPWFFNSSEDLFTNFFRTLEQKVRPHNFQMAKDIAQYGKHFSTIEKTFLKTQFTANFINQAPKDFQIRFENLKKMIRSSGKSLLIVIDDLDRLANSEIVNVLKLVRLIADFPNTIYLLNYDREYVVDAISQQLTPKKANTYLEKIIQLEFRIPKHDPDTIIDLLQKHIKDKLDNHLRDRFDDEKKIMVIEAAQLDFVKDFIRNIRDIRRFSNNFLNKATIPDIVDEVNLKHLFLLELIDYVNDEEYQFLYENIQLAIEENRIVSQKIEGVYSDREKEGYVGEKTPERVKKVIDLLKDEARKGVAYPLLNKSYYHRYFSLALFDRDISELDFNECFVNSKYSYEYHLKIKEWININPELLIEKLRRFDEYIVYIDIELLIPKILYVFKERYISLVRESKKTDDDDLIFKLKGIFAGIWNNYEVRVVSEIISSVLIGNVSERINNMQKAIFALLDAQTASFILGNTKIDDILFQFHDIIQKLLDELIKKNTKSYFEVILEIMKVLGNYSLLSSGLVDKYEKQVLDKHAGFFIKNILTFLKIIRSKNPEIPDEESDIYILFRKKLFDKSYIESEKLRVRIHFFLHKEFLYHNEKVIEIEKKDTLYHNFCLKYNNYRIEVHSDEDERLEMKLIFYNKNSVENHEINIVKYPYLKNWVISVNDETVLQGSTIKDFVLIVKRWDADTKLILATKQGYKKAKEYTIDREFDNFKVSLINKVQKPYLIKLTTFLRPKDYIDKE